MFHRMDPNSRAERQYSTKYSQADSYGTIAYARSSTTLYRAGVVLLRVPTIGLLLICAFSAEAEIKEVSPADDLTSAIVALKPGDELVLRTGVYTIGVPLKIAAIGRQDRPIIVRSAQGQDVLIRMTSDQSAVELSGARHLVLRELRLHGGKHAIRIVDADFVTIDGCELAETQGAALMADGSGVHQGLVVRNTHIHDTGGPALQFGCQDGVCRVANSIVEWNHLHDAAGSIARLEAGSSGVVMRHNVMYRSQRPAVVTESTLGDAVNIVDSNLIFAARDAAIQSSADLNVRNNIVLGSPILLLADDSGAPANQTILHNTIVTDGNAIETRGVRGAIVIANNALYSKNASAIAVTGDASLVTLAGNVGSTQSGPTTGFVAGKDMRADFVRAHTDGAPPIDVFPREGSALIGAGSSDYAIELDFNGIARQGTLDAGAYRFQPGGNPGWKLAAGFKQRVTVRPKAPTQLSAE